MAKQVIVEYDKHGNLNLTSLIKHGIFVPNWFDKEHFEEFMGIEITQSQFEALAENLSDCGIDDVVSNTVREWLDVNDEDIANILSEKE